MAREDELRRQPAYRDLEAPRHYCRNAYILQWWTTEHDDAIARQIERAQWAWYWGITDEILAITPEDIVEIWRMVDPLYSEYAWYNIIMNFAASRATVLGLTNAIRKPEWKTCPLCENAFVEDSLPHWAIKRLGIDDLEFCAPCLEKALFDNQGNDSASREEALAYLQDLSDALYRVPVQGISESPNLLHGLSASERLAILRVLKRKPTTRRVKELFGSWLEALIEAEILEDGTRRTSRGTHCLAKDGHVCLSLGEKTIDDFLYEHGIQHEIEPPYPEGGFRADFIVDDVLIEYFGLKGDPEYDSKTDLKKRICRKHGIRLISIYPSDLVSSRRLESKLLGGLATQDVSFTDDALA